MCKISVQVNLLDHLEPVVKSVRGNLSPSHGIPDHVDSSAKKITKRQ